MWTMLFVSSLGYWLPLGAYDGFQSKRSRAVQSLHTESLGRLLRNGVSLQSGKKFTFHYHFVTRPEIRQALPDPEKACNIGV
jgi:hypothetical protein